MGTLSEGYKRGSVVQPSVVGGREEGRNDDLLLPKEVILGLIERRGLCLQLEVGPSPVETSSSSQQCSFVEAVKTRPMRGCDSESAMKSNGIRRSFCDN